MTNQDDLLGKLRDAYVAAKQGDNARCAALLEACLAAVKPAKGTGKP